MPIGAPISTRLPPGGMQLIALDGCRLLRDLPAKFPPLSRAESTHVEGGVDRD